MISIVIAAYNEERRIGESLLKIKDYLTGRDEDYEIIVVDDGSTDNTGRVIADYKPEIANLKMIRYPKNRGKGYALRKGVLASTGDAILLTDADLSTPIEELPRLLPLISSRKYDGVIGSRALKSGMLIRKQPWWRQGMGKLFNKIVRFMVLDDFSDTQCGFKIFSGDTAKSLFKNACIDRFAYDVEILAIAKKSGCRILEVPVKWIDSPGSKVHPVWDSLQMLFDLIKIRKHLNPKENQS